MKRVTIQLFSISDIKQFVNTANLYDFDIDMTSGRYVIDAKSIMGLFSLDLNKPIQVEIHSDDYEDFLKSIEPFLVQEA